MSCNNNPTYIENWKFNHSKLENHQGYLKSNDTINLYINKINQYPNGNNNQVFLRSHDVQFTIGNDTFQEVVCHNERLGGNDEVSNLFDLFFLFKSFVQVLRFYF